MIPETRDLFYPEPETAVAYNRGAASRIGRDLEAEILVVDSGRVVARSDGQEFAVNSSLERYRDALALVAGVRDRLAANTCVDSDGEVEALMRALQALDASSYAAPNSYWAAIVEQLAHEQF